MSLNLRKAKYLDQVAGNFLCWLFGMFHAVRELFLPGKPVADVRNLLLVKFWGVGNLFLIHPIIAEIRRLYPEAEIHFLTLSLNREVIERNRSVDHVHTLDTGGLPVFMGSLYSTIRRLRKLHPDISIDFEQFSHTSPLLSFLAGTKQRIGFNTSRKPRSSLYTVQVPYNNTQHMRETFFDLARAAGVRGDYPSGKGLLTLDRDEERIREFIPSGIRKTLVACIHPGSGDNFTGRRWPEENFAVVADCLMEKYGAWVIFTGGSDEKELIDRISALMKGTPVDSSSRLSVMELAALIGKSDFIISNDTGPVHIASTLGVPVVGFYGPNTPVLYGPTSPNSVSFYKKLPCSPCITNFNAKTSSCRIPVCIRNIGVEEVLEAIDSMLSPLGLHQIS